MGRARQFVRSFWSSEPCASDRRGYAIGEWKTSHAAQRAPIINQGQESIYGRSATNKSLAVGGKSCSRSFLRQSQDHPPSFLPSPSSSSSFSRNVAPEKLEICSCIAATQRVQTCSEFRSDDPRDDRTPAFLVKI